jgi:mRNA (guanine-N7-)-methyltransferase
MQKLPTWSLQNEPLHASDTPVFRNVRGGGISLEDKFDVVSIQFAIHYMMSSRMRARRFFQTVSQLLEIGGNLIVTTIDARMVLWHLMNLGMDFHFEYPSCELKPATVRVGGGACRIHFEPDIVKQIFTANSKDLTDSSLFGVEYTFTLVEGSDQERGFGDAVNLPEWLTPLPVLEALAKEAGFELEYAQNFHEFYAARSDLSSNVGAHTALYNMKVLNRNGSISEEEWEISRMYIAMKFRKVKESDMCVEEDEDESDLSGEDDTAEIDPALKAKMFPIALMNAKRTIGTEAWDALSADEKTRLTDAELQKLQAAKNV